MVLNSPTVLPVERDFPLDRIYNGDFFNIYPLLNRRFNLILTDPPYNSLNQTQKWDVKLDWKEIERIFDELLFDDGLVLLFCDLSLYLLIMNTWGKYFKYKHHHIWRKPGGMPVTKLRPINNAEFILCFKKISAKEKDLTFNPYEMTEKALPYFKRNLSTNIPTRRMKKSTISQNTDGSRFPKVIMDAPGKPNMIKKERSCHPTQKPELLLRRLISGYSNPGELILDPFSGSGSAIISAIKESRKAIGIEKNQAFYEESINRLEQIVNQAELFHD